MCQSLPVSLCEILWLSISLTCVCCVHVGPLMVKDEYDYDNQQSHSSSESHLQTIQHPPSRPGPQETFSSPSLLPPSEGSSSASTSAFSTISAGPSSKTLHKDNIMEHTLSFFKICQSEINECERKKYIYMFLVFSFFAPAILQIKHSLVWTLFLTEDKVHMLLTF